MSQLVSILIPAYNAEKWIQECIKSALAQTWNRKEIIVVNDGSRDATLRMAQSFASRTVKVVTQENAGASAARNRALSLAQGEYIQWLDADDLLAPDKISSQMYNAEPGMSSRLLLSGSWGRMHHNAENAVFMPDSLWENLEPREWLYRKIKEDVWMAIESWLVSRKLTDISGPWDEEMSLDDDGEYFCRVLYCSSGVRFIRNARCYCRRATVGLSQNLTSNSRKQESLLKSLLAHIRIMRSMEDSYRVRAACLELLNRSSIDFYPERPDLLDQMRGIANELGGDLYPPRLRVKYRWIKALFGWKIAKRAQNTVPFIKAISKYQRERLVLSLRGKK